MPEIDIAKLPIDAPSTYAEPFAHVVAGRSRKRSGVAARYNAGGRYTHKDGTPYPK